MATGSIGYCQIIRPAAAVYSIVGSQTAGTPTCYACKMPIGGLSFSYYPSGLYRHIQCPIEWEKGWLLCQ